MIQLLAGAGPGQGQLFPGESWSRPRLWPNSWAMEEATPKMLVEWSYHWGGKYPKSNPSLDSTQWLTYTVYFVPSSSVPLDTDSSLIANEAGESKPGCQEPKF